jgi:hypothetical protein
LFDPVVGFLPELAIGPGDVGLAVIGVPFLYGFVLGEGFFAVALVAGSVDFWHGVSALMPFPRFFDFDGNVSRSLGRVVLAVDLFDLLDLLRSDQLLFGAGEVVGGGLDGDEVGPDGLLVELVGGQSGEYGVEGHLDCAAVLERGESYGVVALAVVADEVGLAVVVVTERLAAERVGVAAASVRKDVAALRT